MPSATSSSSTGRRAAPDTGLLTWDPPGGLTQTENFTAIVRATEDSANALFSDETITVTFVKRQTLAINVNPEGAGTTTGAGVYDWASAAPITAAANAGFRFFGWTGAGVADTGAADTTVEMSADRTVTATRELAARRILALPTGAGRIRPRDATPGRPAPLIRVLLVQPSLQPPGGGNGVAMAVEVM